MRIARKQKAPLAAKRFILLQIVDSVYTERGFRSPSEPAFPLNKQRRYSIFPRENPTPMVFDRKAFTNRPKQPDERNYEEE